VIVLVFCYFLSAIERKTKFMPCRNLNWKPVITFDGVYFSPFSSSLVRTLHVLLISQQLQLFFLSFLSFLEFKINDFSVVEKSLHRPNIIHKETRQFYSSRPLSIYSILYGCVVCCCCYYYMMRSYKMKSQPKFLTTTSLWAVSLLDKQLIMWFANATSISQPKSQKPQTSSFLSCLLM
jgi:hypothetical protein